MEATRKFTPVREQAIQAVSERRDIVNPVISITCNVKKKHKEIIAVPPPIKLRERKRIIPLKQNTVVDQKVLLQREYNKLRSYISASKLKKGRRVKVSCADILFHTEKLKQSLFDNRAINNMIDLKNIEHIKNELRRLNTDSFTPTKPAMLTEFNSEVRPNCKTFYNVGPRSPPNSVSGNIFSTLKSEMTPQHERAKSRVNNSTLYFSHKIHPEIDASKRREFLRGLDDYITKKCMKENKKACTAAISPSGSPKKSFSPRRKKSTQRFMIRRKNKSLSKGDKQFPKKKLFINSSHQIGSFKDFVFPNTKTPFGRRKHVATPNWNPSITKKIYTKPIDF
ncbi:unnamed protein product [Moneuplotes crassus]|uniref:Uncharacterized protein n=1 Tax=Euplotes crassus TaxID=5936 RepID=A0AAD1UNX0_EUPCR|nr:unnamed protein product [Moneuplotes crassus]